MIWQIAIIVAIFIAYKLNQRRRYRKTIKGKFEDRHVFITGCDSGFGYDLAMRLDALGFHVYAGCFTSEGTESLKQNSSMNLTTLQIDVRNIDSIRLALDIVSDCLPEGKGLWGLVNNAGVYGSITHTEWLTKQDYESVMDVNFYGTVEVTRTFLPLITKEKGRIINMSSAHGRFAIGSVPYTVASHAIEAYSDRLRQDMYNTGVTVHVIEPGHYKTDLFDFDEMTEQYRESWERLPLDRKKYYGNVYSNAYGEKAMNVISTVSSITYDAVTEAFVHALTGQCPKHRYVIGKDANRVFLPLSWMPESWSDFLLKMQEHIPDSLDKKLTCPAN